MARTVNQVMTQDPRSVSPSDSIAEAARHMRDGDTGAIIVVDGGEVLGIVTDRDIVVRAIADGRDPASTKVSDVATTTTITVTPDQSAADAAKLMREHDIRRLVVVHDGRPAGIVSIGDLAIELDEGSALADLSSAPPNN
jgi:CBS domain-containing protein